MSLAYAIRCPVSLVLFGLAERVPVSPKEYSLDVLGKSADGGVWYGKQQKI